MLRVRDRLLPFVKQGTEDQVLQQLGMATPPIPSRVTSSRFLHVSEPQSSHL